MFPSQVWFRQRKVQIADDSPLMRLVEEPKKQEFLGICLRDQALFWGIGPAYQFGQSTVEHSRRSAL